MTEVRTRFAPSPTGFLHVGSVRTAMFAWLLARHHNGVFILRIEDTDQERKVPGAIRSILSDLAWFGIVPDEGPSKDEIAKVDDASGVPDIGGPHGPYIQSLRLPRYKEVAEQLVASGAAYRCDCTHEMLEHERVEQMARKEQPGYSGYCRTRNVSASSKHVVRLKIPHKLTLSYNDAIKGHISWDGVSLRDAVLLKSDGYPMYNFAVVVDDHDMKISHIMRGDEFVSTTPIHLLLYQALGWETPVIAHLPNILGNDGKKLSKRHGSTFVSAFKDDGYLEEALLNYTVLIGWSPGAGNQQEIFSRDELIQHFSLEGINNASGMFDYNKLSWMNGIYMRNLSIDEFTKRAQPFMEKAGLKVHQERWNLIAPFVKERVKLLTEVAPMVEFLFVDNIQRDIESMYQKGVDQIKAKEILIQAQEKLVALQDFSIKAIEEELRPLAEKLGLKVGAIFNVLRIAVTGKKITPPLFESFVALGKLETLRRLDETIAMVS
jgi:glutamyl-tRNA synthetase